MKTGLYENDTNSGAYQEQSTGRIFSITLVTALLLVLLSILIYESYAVGAGRLVAGLLGINEVPKVYTNATGSIAFSEITNDLLKYTLNVTNLENITEAGIYIGKEGETGPLAVSLFKFESPVTISNGTLSQGNLTSSNLEGPMAGNKLTELTSLMNSGGTYLSISTQQNPTGEIRGQIGFEGIDESGTTLGQYNDTTQVEQGHEM